MAVSEKQLAEKLKEAGNRLLSPPSSVDELHSILDEVEKILENVEQSPSQTMQDALWPSRNALVSQGLLGHSDPDVKVSVATCISEITRITAPDAPYSDDQMKEIFQLIVSSFENLHEMSSRSYNKRIAILDIVAKVRSCVVMLDLECDNLILEMFQHFFKSVRDHHPEKVLSSMETIMVLVLEESEDISPELLSSILETLKKDNKNVDPIARRLCENVLNKCASKVKPYLLQAIKTLEISVDDYSNIVAGVCQQLSSDVESNGVNIASINKVNQANLPNPSSEGAVKEVKETVENTAPQAEVSPAPEKVESTMSNGNLQKGVEEAEVVKELLSEQKCDEHTEKKATEESKMTKDEADLTIKPQAEEKCTKKRGRKGDLSKSKLKPCEATPAVDKDAEEVTNLQESKSKDSEILHCEDTPAYNTSPNSEKGFGIPHPSYKVSENEALDAASPSPRGDTPEESDVKKVDVEIKAEDVPEVRTLPEDEDNSIKEPVDFNKVPEDSNKQPEDSNKQPEDSNKEPEDSNKEPEVSNKEPEDSNKEPEADASASMADKITDQGTSSATDKEETSLHPVDASKKDDRSTIVSDSKTAKMSGKQAESVSEQQAEKKTKGQGKAKIMKDHVKPPPKKESKESDCTPKAAKKEPSSASSKRKRSAGKEKASGIDKYGEELVGSKIMVWWPKDKQFYQGVVKAFIPTTKRHKVLYSDGDVEYLNMDREKWQFNKDGENSDKGYASDGENPDASSELRTKKKIKAIPDPSNKPGNSLSAKKKVGGTSSSRSKVAVSKPGKTKQSNEKNVEKLSNDEVDSKYGGGSEDEKVEKSSDANSGDESMDETPKGSIQSKEDDVETPKPNIKSKQQTTKGNNARSKGKSSAKGSGSKSNANKTGKAKAGSSSVKGKESEKTKKSQNDTAKSSQGGKNKASSTITPSKAQKIETNSGKKRKRGSSKK